MGEQYFVEPLEAETRGQNLALSAFAAIEQKAVLAVHDEVGGEAPVGGGGSGGGAEKNEFKHGVIKPCSGEK